MRTKGSLNFDIKSVYFEYPAYGFQSDVEILINKFVETNSIRFEEFSKIWRESDFSLVHLGRNGLKEIRTFLDDAYKVVVKYLLPPYNTQVRVAALYILYGLYYTQRAEPKVRIRFPLSSWSDFMELLSEIKIRGHLDVAFIGRKMLKERVFYICAYSTPLSVDELEHKNSEPGLTSNSQDCTSPKRSKGIQSQSQSTILSQAVDEDSLGQLSAVHEKYHQLKCQQNLLAGGLGTSPSSALDLIKPSLAKPITEIALSRKEKKSQAAKRSTRESTISDEDEANYRAKQIKEIKQRAFGEQQRSTTESADLAESSKDDEKESRKYRRRGRPYQEVSLPPPKKAAPPKRTSSTQNALGKNTSLIEDIESEQSQDDELPDIYIPEIPTRKTSATKTSSENAQGKPEEAKIVATTSKRQRKKSLPSVSNEPDVPKKKKKTEKETKTKKKTEKKKNTNTPKVSRSSVPTEEESRALSVMPSEFVALRPNQTHEHRPVIGKVLRIISDEEIEIEWYIGGYISLWTSLALINEAEIEGKVPKEAVKRSDIIMGGFKLTKHQTLPPKIRKDLREMYSIIDGKD